MIPAQIKVQSNSTELFTLANSLRKQGLNQKEAFAEARSILGKKNLRSKLVADMANGVVTITFTNRKGKTESAKATTCPSEIPSRKIGGRSTARNDEMVTFYDKIHGMYRSVKVANIISFT